MNDRAWRAIMVALFLAGLLILGVSAREENAGVDEKSRFESGPRDSHSSLIQKRLARARGCAIRASVPRSD